MELKLHRWSPWQHGQLVLVLYSSQVQQQSAHTTVEQSTSSTGHWSVSQQMGHSNSCRSTTGCSSQIVALVWCTDVAGGAISWIAWMQYRGLSLRGRPVVCCAFLGHPPFCTDSKCWHTLQLLSLCSLHPSNTTVLCLYPSDCAFWRTSLHAWQNCWGWAVGLSCIPCACVVGSGNETN